MSKKLLLLKLLPVAFLAVGVCVGYWNHNFALLI
jgi:hypothetical protein